MPSSVVSTTSEDTSATGACDKAYLASRHTEDSMEMVAQVGNSDSHDNARYVHEDKNRQVEVVDGAVSSHLEVADAKEKKSLPLSIDTNVTDDEIDDHSPKGAQGSSIPVGKITDGLNSDNILTAKRAPKVKRHDNEEYEPIPGSASDYQYESWDNSLDRNSNKKMKSNKYSAFDDQRSGKWTVDEENFANQLVKDFERGFLDDCEEGITLRSYLARRLNCAPMRISKKFSGRCIGKLSYVKCDSSFESEKLKSPLSRLEEIYIQSYQNKKSCKSRRNSRNRRSTHNVVMEYKNPDYTYSDDNYDDNENDSTSDEYEESTNGSDTDTYNSNHYLYGNATGTSLDPLMVGVGFDDHFDSSLSQVYDDKEADEWKAVLLSLNESTVAKIFDPVLASSMKSDGSNIVERINRSRSIDKIQNREIERSSSWASLLV